MKIAAISDTHEEHARITTFPEADVFIYAGDFTMIGETAWVESFNWWLGTLPYRHKLVIAGNHDRCFDVEDCFFHELLDENFNTAREYGQRHLSNAKYLIHEGLEVDGVKFWFSPYTPFFSSTIWKFHYDRAAGKQVWEDIPDGVDILVTHGPPMYEGDKTLEGDFAGCWDLNRRVKEIKPKHHIFGHIHEGFGTTWDGYTTYHNVSAVDRLYRLRENPWTVIEL